MEHADSDYYHYAHFKWWDSWALRKKMMCPNPYCMSVAEPEMRTGLGFYCPEPPCFGLQKHPDQVDPG